MTRGEIAANGITSVLCLVVRGSIPREYLCPPTRPGRITSPDEGRAEVWVREIDALEIKRRAEHLTGLGLDLVRRPTLVGGADPYCPKCGHVGGHDPFCGTLRIDRFPERVRQGDDELAITVTELAAGMATATFREETGIAPDEHLPSAWGMKGGAK